MGLEFFITGVGVLLFAMVLTETSLVTHTTKVNMAEPVFRVDSHSSGTASHIHVRISGLMVRLSATIQLQSALE
jgi:hypothetical protein